MKIIAEQLPLFEIEPEDAEAIYGTAWLPFLVAVTSPVTLTANLTAGTHTPADTHPHS